MYIVTGFPVMKVVTLLKGNSSLCNVVRHPKAAGRLADIKLCDGQCDIASTLNHNDIFLEATATGLRCNSGPTTIRTYKPLPNLYPHYSMKAHIKGDHIRVLPFSGSSRSQRNRQFANLAKSEFMAVI